MEYVALDLETTGLDPEWDRVIEVGAVAFTAEGVQGRLERLANPGRSVPEAVLQLTGIEARELVDAPPAADALAELAAFLQGRQPVGHGARIEIGFLAAAGLWPEAAEMLDTLDLARILLPGAASHSLPLLAGELGLRQVRPHRALDDADATRQLLLALRARAAALDEARKEQVLALVAPYAWPVAGFFAEALTTASPAAEELRPAPAAPAAVRGRTRVPEDPAGLAGLLAPSGPLAASLPQYEHREGQVQMLLAVAQTMRRGGTLMVEAGTGTGKSLAYLVPALARAVAHGERAVVATHTHTLQEQLLTKDIPDLQTWLPWSFEPCLLKGRANYLSLRRWRRYLAEPCRDEEELRFKLKVLLWLHGTETGDRSELRLHGRQEVLWAQIASDPLDCVGVHCRSDDCFVHRAREQAGRADLVIVNHALLLADSQAEGGLLPPYEHLIVDEAHHLEDAATQGLRCDVEGAGVEALLERLTTERPGRAGLLDELLARPRPDASGDDLDEAARLAAGAHTRVTELFRAFAEWLRTGVDERDGRRDDTLRLTPEVRESPGWAPLAASAGGAATALTALDTQLGRVVTLSRDFLGQGGGGEPSQQASGQPDQALRELEIVRGRLAECEHLLREAFTEPDPGRVYWLSAPGRNSSLSVRSAPLDVGPVLHDQVFADRRSVVLTSASLAVAGSFGFARSRTGVTDAAEALVVESPFDYLRQALICLPTDLPVPDDEALEPFLSEVVADVASRLGGRTLALFTSHGQLRDVYDALKQRSDVDELLFLAQGIDGQRRQLLETFQARPHGVLLGTASFWEGIDLPGDLLSCVIVVRLPFPVPSEPIYAARAERLRDPFAQYALPRAALRLKQGFGRLIRRSDDRGAVVVLDSRIVRRDYGRAFLEALPPASRFQGPIAEVGARVERWVEAGV